jgi:DUF1009 family protein
LGIKKLVAEKLGLVAGNGDFPGAFIYAAKQKGYEVYTVAHIGESKPEVIEPGSLETCWVRIGQFKKVIDFFKKRDVARVAFLGGISRPKMLSSVRPDLLAVKLVAKAGTLQDVPLLKVIAAEFESQGIQVIDPREILSDWRCELGQLTRRSCNGEELKSALVGWQAAKKLGSLDVGQTVVVAAGVITAVEAVEGTDAAILRGGSLNRPGLSVVVKVKKPHQDEKIDLPAVGEGTIDIMIKAGCSALILEEHGALILDPEKVAMKANAAGIAIEVYNESTLDAAYKNSGVLDKSPLDSFLGRAASEQI